MTRPLRCGLVGLLIAMFCPLGCDDRASQVAIDAANQQAEQNRELARMNREHTAARRELIELHQHVQTERQALSSGWQDLHTEQQQVLAEQRTESLLASLVPLGAAGLVAWLLVRLVSRWLDYQTIRTVLAAELPPPSLASSAAQPPYQLEPPTPGALTHEPSGDDHDTSA